MGQISYTNIEDGTPITANVFNERLGDIIAMINGGLDQTNFADGGIPAAALDISVFDKIYPVGSIYSNATDSTNPGTLLGFGTWVAFGAGKVAVGYDASDTDFNASEKTGGEKSHTLTTAEMPSHNHSISTNGDHSHGFTRDIVVTSGGGIQRTYLGGGSGQQLAWNGSAGMANAGSHSHTIGNNGSGSAHSNLQPFVTVYLWKRTA